MADGLLVPRPTPDSDQEHRLQNPIHNERHVRIICIGAGASGLLFAYKMQRHFDNFSLTVYEKNPEVSGTWFENRYPGWVPSNRSRYKSRTNENHRCACDVPAHTYTWSFEPKIDWSAVYASSREINDYFNEFMKKYNLQQYIHTRHQGVGAYWNQKYGGWDVKIKDLNSGKEFDDHCDILINAGGILNNWRWPAISGLHDFKGPLLHTANWNDDIDLRGKHVGLIGNGYVFFVNITLGLY